MTRSSESGPAGILSGSKALLVLAWLATRPSGSARREDVAEFFWPGLDRPRALRALRQALFFLSRHGDDVLIKSDESLQLDRARFQVDLWDLDLAVRQADYARVIELYGGRFAAGMERKVGAEAEHWIEEENSRLQVALEVAYSKRIAEAVAAGQGAEAEQLARAYAADNPLDDARQVLLIRTLKATGDDLGALRAYETYRRSVTEDTADPPPEELSRAMEQLRAELLAPPEPAAPLPPPSPPLPPPLVEESVALPRPGDLGERWPWRRERVLLLSAVGALALVAVLLGRSRRDVLTPAFLTGLKVSFLALQERAGQSQPVGGFLDRGRVRVRETSRLPPYAVPVSGGRVVAFAEQAPNGWNVAVREGRRPSRTLTHQAGDEFPLAWSPDGRYLLLTHRRLLADRRTQSYSLWFYDLDGDSLHAFTTLESREWPGVAWSPDGSQIAFTAERSGRPDLFLADFDGANLRNLTRSAAPERDPAWAPDRSRLAFAATRREDANLFAIQPDGSNLQELTRLTGDERAPIWLSPSALLLLAGGTDPEWWALDLAGGGASRLGPAPGLRRVVAVRTPVPAWVDRVRIAPRVRVASPGQYVAFEAVALDQAGLATQYALLPLRWEVRDSTLAAIRPDGWTRFLRPGPTTLRLSLGGWRTDSLELIVLPLERVAVAPAFEESWAHGLGARWRAFGDPQPLARPAGGPHGRGRLLNRGDAFFASGVVSRDVFDLAQGLAVEVEGRMRFTGKLHQVFAVDLVPEAASDSALASGQQPPIVGLRVQGPAGAEAGETAILTADGKRVIPRLEATPFWHVYTLQVQPDGTVQLIVDDQLYWQMPSPLSRRALGKARLVLGLESLETEIAHGAVRVYPAPRYRPPAWPPAPAPR